MTGDVVQIRTRGASRNARTGGNGGDMAADGEGAQLTTDKLAPAIHSHAIAYNSVKYRRDELHLGSRGTDF